MGRMQYFAQLTPTHILCYEETRVVAKVSRSTLQKNIPLRVNKKWRIEKVADAPEKYRVMYSFDYAPDVYLYVTDDASIVPFRVSLIQQIAILVMFLFVGAFWLIFANETMSIVNNDHGFIAAAIFVGVMDRFVPVATVILVMLQFWYCVRYTMLFKQNKIYYSWF